MELNKTQSDAFAKIIKKGMAHYKCVPHSLGQFSETNPSEVIGYVIWQDPEANFTTEKGDTNQEFYIKEDGTVCVYINKEFVPVVFRAKNWKSFTNPSVEGSEVG